MPPFSRGILPYLWVRLGVVRMTFCLISLETTFSFYQSLKLWKPISKRWVEAYI